MRRRTAKPHEDVMRSMPRSSDGLVGVMVESACVLRVTRSLLSKLDHGSKKKVAEWSGASSAMRRCCSSDFRLQTLLWWSGLKSQRLFRLRTLPGEFSLKSQQPSDCTQPPTSDFSLQTLPCESSLKTLGLFRLQTSDFAWGVFSEVPAALRTRPPSKA